MSRFAVLAAFVALACVTYAVADEACFDTKELKENMKAQKEEHKQKFVLKMAKLEQKNDASLDDKAAAEKAIEKIKSAKATCKPIKKESKEKGMECFFKELGLDKQSAEDADECFQEMKALTLKELKNESKRTEVTKCFDSCQGKPGMESFKCAIDELKKVCPEVKECMEKGHDSEEA